MKRFLLCALLACASFAAAGTATWQTRPDHAASQFSVRHLGFSSVRGQFMKTSGTVGHDPSGLSKTQIDVTMDAASVDARIQMRDNDLGSDHFLDVAKYPGITCKSKEAGPGGRGKLTVTGDLTIRGTTKEAVLDVAGPSEPARAMRGVRMGAEAVTKINRKDFEVNGAPSVVGDDIQITFDVERTRPAR